MAFGFHPTQFDIHFAVEICQSVEKLLTQSFQSDYYWGDPKTLLFFCYFHFVKNFSFWFSFHFPLSCFYFQLCAKCKNKSEKICAPPTFCPMHESKLITKWNEKEVNRLCGWILFKCRHKTLLIYWRLLANTRDFLTNEPTNRTKAPHSGHRLGEVGGSWGSEAAKQKPKLKLSH